jgi:hypothetical protein
MSLATVDSSVESRTFSVRSPSPRPAFLTPALETMVRIRRRRKHGVFLIVAAETGAGTSYVVSLLANELTREFGNCVMVSSPSGSTTASIANVAGGGSLAFREQAPNVWVPVRERDFDNLSESEQNEVVVGMNPEAFDFVLVDSPALSTGQRPVRLGQPVDGVFLVVEAGKTKCEQIEQAQRHFAASGARLLGVILNRRTYEIGRAHV